METTNVREEARKLIEKLPDHSTWDDLMREIFVRQVIEAGLADSQAGRTTRVEEVRTKFGLKKCARSLD
jgi:predicted transcriptional regulator